MNSAQPLIVCMGVSGAGKSTLARSLAELFKFHLLEADDYHSDSCKRRMASGRPIDDADRDEWMGRVCDAISTVMQNSAGCVIALSALRRTHRQRVRHLGYRTLFLHLDGERELIAKRMANRKDHYMPVELLDSQIDSLQDTSDEPNIEVLDIGESVTDIVAVSSQRVAALMKEEHQECD